MSSIIRSTYLCSCGSLPRTLRSQIGMLDFVFLRERTTLCRRMKKHSIAPVSFCGCTLMMVIMLREKVSLAQRPG